MATEGRAAGETGGGAVAPRSHLFAVRLWKAETADGPEYRGSVREVVSGAFRGFRTWSDLTAFLIARVEETDGAHGGEHAEGDDGTGETPAPPTTRTDAAQGQVGAGEGDTLGVLEADAAVADPVDHPERHHARSGGEVRGAEAAPRHETGQGEPGQVRRH
jgi:hypothetical protein